MTPGEWMTEKVHRDAARQRRFWQKRECEHSFPVLYVDDDRLLKAVCPHCDGVLFLDPR